MYKTTITNEAKNKVSIPKTMKAVVAYEPGDYRLEEVPVPTIGEGEIHVKVEACGICAGDLKA
ncbi:Sorbitol dehydrogenase [compost metagenome]